MSLNRFYHVHFEDLQGEPGINFFETGKNAWNFVHACDKVGAPVGYPVGSEDHCQICDE